LTGSLSRYEFAGTAPLTRNLMKRYASFFDEGPVVDLGSGRGFFLEALRKRGVAGVGVDISGEAMQHARDLGVEFVKGDALEFLRGKSGLRGVFASHLIEHMAPETAEEMIALAAAALTRGGRLVVVTPNLKDYRTLSEVFWLDTTHVRPYPGMLIAALMQRHGLTVDEVGRTFTLRNVRSLPSVALGRLRFGRDYGCTEIFVRAHR